MVETYTQRPWIRLTLRECRMMIRGAPTVVADIHAFLEEWEIINLHSTLGKGANLRDRHRTCTCPLLLRRHLFIGCTIIDLVHLWSSFMHRMQGRVRNLSTPPMGKRVLRS